MWKNCQPVFSFCSFQHQETEKEHLKYRLILPSRSQIQGITMSKELAKKTVCTYFFNIKENILNYNWVYGKQGQRSIAPTAGWFLIPSLRSCFSFHPGSVNPVPPKIPLGTYHTRQGKRLESVKENPELWITPLSSSSFSVGSEHPPNAYIQKPSQRYDLSKVEKKLLKCV